MNQRILDQGGNKRVPAGKVLLDRLHLVSTPHVMVLEVEPSEDGSEWVMTGQIFSQTDEEPVDREVWLQAFNHVLDGAHPTS